MKIDQNKLQELFARQVAQPTPDELRREEGVFFVGGTLPERETLETLFDSHYQCNASLFHLTFGDLGSFSNGESLARTIKKNFNAHLVGRLDFPAPPHLIERAYAAGVDIIDIPVRGIHPAGEGETADQEARLKSLDSARAIFPRWSVASSLVAGEEPAAATAAGIDLLLARDVIPLVTLSGRAAQCPAAEISKLYLHLHAGWRAKKAVIKPLLPLIELLTPLVPASARGGLRGFIDLIDGRRLLATSDLRRILRVKEVEESYASSGL